MLYRTLSLGLAVALFVASAALARPDTKEGSKKAGNTHSGKFVATKGAHQFVMTDRDGKSEHTHTLAADATITCDGKTCKLSDLKPGTLIRVTTAEKDGKKVVTKVEATTRGAGGGAGRSRDR
jgi:hypothetical protein